MAASVQDANHHYAIIFDLEEDAEGKALYNCSSD